MRKYPFLLPDDPPGGGAPTPPADPPTPPADPPAPPDDPPAPPVDPPAPPADPPAPPADPPTPPADPPKAPTPEIIQAELKAAAALAGVPKEQIPYVLRLADVKVGTDNADLAKLAEDAVAKVLADIPALAGTQNGTGAIGDHRRTPDKKQDPFEQGFARK